MMQFLNEVKIELSRVIWPKFDEWVGSTVVVMVIVAAFAVYLGALDFGLNHLARYIFEQYGIQ
ncbi:MAG: preprotein translocase subunit SecE [Candidatus Dependentiae bacterium]|nr:preprotein translocase subunit SecE [Candidatus Dependentiae bacterium]